VVLNKIDLLDDEQRALLLERFQTELGPQRQINVISAITGAGLDELTYAVMDHIEARRQRLADDPEAQADEVRREAQISDDVLQHALLRRKSGLAADGEDGEADGNAQDGADGASVEVFYVRDET
jgi:50S ribosomal subunit-associated GTPase HflX